MSSSSGRTKTNSPSESSSSTAEAEAEEHEPILEDVSNGDTDSDDDKGRKKKKDHCDDDDDEEEQEEMKLTEFHAKNYFNSTMGGKDLRVLFAMAIGCHSMDIPDHKDPPFCRSKTYHSEIKPDSSTLKLEVTRQWKAYKTSGRQLRPANWKIEKSCGSTMAERRDRRMEGNTRNDKRESAK